MKTLLALVLMAFCVQSINAKTMVIGKVENNAAILTMDSKAAISQLQKNLKTFQGIDAVFDKAEVVTTDGKYKYNQ